MAQILVIDDQDRLIGLCRRALPDHAFVGPARTWPEARSLVRAARGRVDLVLLDVHFDLPPDQLIGWRAGMTDEQTDGLRRRQGLEILRVLRREWPDLPVVLTTARDDLPADASAADDAEDLTFFLDDDRLDARVIRGWVERLSARRREPEAEGPVFFGRSLIMDRVRSRLAVVSGGRLPVTLLGPTGTGKSLIAEHVLHRRSGRSGPFVALDVSTIPAELVAGQLFGAARGAYTGAITDRIGAFEAAHRGTLFLDEIGNLSADAQKLLLLVLEEGQVARLGETKKRAVDVKLVVATHEDLAARVRAGTFRADLWMRLNPSASVVLPALVDRGLDLEDVARFCLGRALERPYLRELLAAYRDRVGCPGDGVRLHLGAKVPEPSPGDVFVWVPERVVRLLRAHSWPGNLREFSMTLENAVLFALAEASDAGPGERADVVPLRPRLVRELLSVTGALPTPAAGAAAPPAAERDDDDGPSLGPAPSAPPDPRRFEVWVEPQQTLNDLSQSFERQVYTELFRREAGSFARMAAVLTGSEEHARRVQLRFNQLGLRVRELKASP